MLKLDINNLNQISQSELRLFVDKLATHLEQGKGLMHIDSTTNKCYLKAVNTPLKNSLPEKVLNDLQIVHRTSLAKGLACSHKKQLEIISKIRNESLPIIQANVTSNFSLQNAPEDILKRILCQFNIRALSCFKPVSQLWSQMASDIQIKTINAEKIPILDISRGEHRENASKAVEWIIANPRCKSLEYANFEHMDGLTAEDLQKLAKHCPNIKHLIIPFSQIKNLEFLKNLPGLLNLDISFCIALKKDSLQNLVYTPELLNLNVSHCKLEPNVLENLKYTRKLINLNISSNTKLKKDSLQYLACTPELIGLNVSHCHFESSALEYLRFTQKLLSLNIINCVKFKSIALNYLKYTPDLLNLQMGSSCEKDVLKYLKNVPNLISLDISECDRLQKDSLKYIKQYLSNLKILNMSRCANLEKESLNYIKDLNLIWLNISQCYELEPGALKNLVDMSTLSSLKFAWCQQFDKDSCTYLNKMTALENLDISGCTQLPVNVLDSLINLPSLTGLKAFGCDQLSQASHDLLKDKNNMPDNTWLNIKKDKNVYFNFVSVTEVLIEGM